MLRNPHAWLLKLWKELRMSGCSSKALNEPNTLWKVQQCSVCVDARSPETLEGAAHALLLT
jgi:hypothetical protein